MFFTGKHGLTAALDIFQSQGFCLCAVSTNLRTPKQNEVVQMWLRYIAMALALLVVANPAHARKHHPYSTATISQSCNILWPCEGVINSPRGERVVKAMGGLGSAAKVYQPQSRGSVIGGRPAGCPHAYCGCGASLFLFGKIIPELNLAYNWVRKFPHVAPAPRMAAARSGHVFVLLSHVEGDNWLVHDANSGHGLTREHVRSIRGYVIVNPHA